MLTPESATARPGEGEPREVSRVGTNDVRIVARAPAPYEGFGLLNREDLAGDVLRVSLRELDRLRARDALPAPLWIGRSPRWSRLTIARWIQLGCPSRERFEALERATEAKP